jgi:hypothetical protein
VKKPTITQGLSEIEMFSRHAFREPGFGSRSY